MNMLIDVKDLVAGVFFIAVGMYFAIGAVYKLNLGTAEQMGPGAFPAVLGAISVCLGLIIALRSLGHATSSINKVSWRGIMLISLSPVCFGVMVRPFGLVPAVAVTVLLAAFASRRITPAFAIALSIGLTACCVVVFRYGLGLPISLIGPRLAFWGP